MTSISATTRRKTNQGPEPRADSRPEPDPETGRSRRDQSLTEEVLEEIEEIPGKIAEALEDVREDVEYSAVARWAVRNYLLLMSHAPQSTRGKLLAVGAVFLIVLAPSLALLYVSLTAGQDATEAWFGDLGYAGVFLANLASTATLFIPVPGLTAAAQALIPSSATTLSPFWVGVLGGLGMAIGEITAYVAGMAASLIAREEEIKAPTRLQPVIDKVTRGVSRLMARYGMPTLFTLSVVPNPLFEVAGWTAGATRYPFWKFMAAVTPGKICRGLLLAYVGSDVFEWFLDVFEPLVSAVVIG
jgi:membrane protein DedA with SNARE-associated domain